MKCWLLVKLTTLFFRFIVQQYHTYSAINKALKDKEVEGALIDVYVLSMQRHLSSNRDLRVLKVFDYQKTYGVVLAGPSMKLEKCFFDFAKFHKWEIYHKIEETIRIPVVCWFYYQKNYYRQRTSFFIRYSKLVQGVRFVWSSFFAVCFYWFVSLTVLLFHASPSIHSSLCMPVCHLCADVCLSVYLSSCLSVRLSIKLFVCLSIKLLSVCQAICFSVSVCQVVCRSIGLSVSLSSCLPISLSFCLPSPTLCIYLCLQIGAQLSISEYKALKNIIYFIHFSHLFPHGSIPLI